MFYLNAYNLRANDTSSIGKKVSFSFAHFVNEADLEYTYGLRPTETLGNWPNN